MDLVVGDVAKKKSGGPKMDVEALLDNGDVRCSWIDASGQLQSGVFPLATLEKFERRQDPLPTHAITSRSAGGFRNR